MVGGADIYFFKEKSWEPVVVHEGEGWVYEVPVASGHIDKTFRFAISQAAFDVLKRDEARRYFLFALLHARYQAHPRADEVLVDPHIEQVLFGAEPEVERLLSQQDAESNGAVSNLVRHYMNRDQEAMFLGRWFGA